MKFNGFKPYYKWNTFNTNDISIINDLVREVLNLIINGIPSIQIKIILCLLLIYLSFKPYYKWNTFNTVRNGARNLSGNCFKPYYKWNTFNTVRNGARNLSGNCFKPYYKWNTFNTFSNDNKSVLLPKSFKPYYKWNTFNT